MWTFWCDNGTYTAKFLFHLLPTRHSDYTVMVKSLLLAAGSTVTTQLINCIVIVLPEIMTVTTLSLCQWLHCHGASDYIVTVPVTTLSPCQWLHCHRASDYIVTVPVTTLSLCQVLNWWKRSFPVYSTVHKTPCWSIHHSLMIRPVKPFF